MQKILNWVLAAILILKGTRILGRAKRVASPTNNSLMIIIWSIT